MIFDFDHYFDWLMGWEGTVYENDPDDPGGATKYGIDQRSHPDVNIRNLTREGAKRIYLVDYWLPVGADRLPPRTAWAVVDCGVNCGRVRAVRWLQAILRVNTDGRMGPVTLGAAGTQHDVRLAELMLAGREGYYRNLARQPKRRKYLQGWLNRNNDLMAKLQS